MIRNRSSRPATPSQRNLRALCVGVYPERLGALSFPDLSSPVFNSNFSTSNSIAPPSVFSLFHPTSHKISPSSSYSSALFCNERPHNSFPINHLRTLSQNTRGGGPPLDPSPFKFELPAPFPLLAVSSERSFKGSGVERSTFNGPFHQECPTLNHFLEDCSTILPLSVGCQLSAVSSPSIPLPASHEPRSEHSRSVAPFFDLSPFNFKLSTVDLLSAISFTIRTYEEHTRNPFRIRTSKTQHLKPFRMNTYEKTGEGGPSLIFSARLCDLCASALSFLCIAKRAVDTRSTARRAPGLPAPRRALLTTPYSLLTAHSPSLGRPLHPAAVGEIAALEETQTPASSPSTLRPTTRSVHKFVGRPVPCRPSSSAVRPSPCFRPRRPRSAALSARSWHRASSPAEC